MKEAQGAINPRNAMNSTNAERDKLVFDAKTLRLNGSRTHGSIPHHDRKIVRPEVSKGEHDFMTPRLFEPYKPDKLNERDKRDKRNERDKRFLTQ